MDNQPTSIDFALIGHQERWQAVSQFVQVLRSPDMPALTEEQIRDSFQWMPPRIIFEVTGQSIQGPVARGVYIETFISPDHLRPEFISNMDCLRSNLKKVQEAAQCAEKAGAKVASLGGFTSILLEGNINRLGTSGSTVFTTGNTLTTAFIVKGVEAACQRHGIALRDARLAVVGSTGDIGTACVRWFAGKVAALSLCARRAKGVEKQAQALQADGVSCRWTTQVEELLPDADVIICVTSASAPILALDDCQPHTLVCDAGFPHNAKARTKQQYQRLWHGGMGLVRGGYRLSPDRWQSCSPYPLPDIGHGCFLESPLLVVEDRLESFSAGRGNISPERIAEMWEAAQRHGFEVAPFYNTVGLWETPETVSRDVAAPSQAGS